MRWLNLSLLGASLGLVGCNSPDEPSGKAENDGVKRANLIAHIKSLGSWPTDGRGAFVDHAMFFDGNHDIGSIAWKDGAADRPGTYRVARVLSRMSQQTNVSRLLIQVVYLDELNLDAWPCGDNVVVVTSASANEVRDWVSELKPSEVNEGWPTHPPSLGAPSLPAGHRAVTIAWLPHPIP